MQSRQIITSLEDCHNGLRKSKPRTLQYRSVRRKLTLHLRQRMKEAKNLKCMGFATIQSARAMRPARNMGKVESIDSNCNLQHKVKLSQTS